jgi:hypothetical protein
VKPTLPTSPTSTVDEPLLPPDPFRGYLTALANQLAQSWPVSSDQAAGHAVRGCPAVGGKYQATAAMQELTGVPRTTAFEAVYDAPE